MTLHTLSRSVSWMFSSQTARSSSHGRNFFPSAAGALNVDKSDRDMLGGWTAQESDRYNRVAWVRVRAVQALVAKTFSNRGNCDPLLEGDAIEEFRLFLQKQGCSAEVHAEYIQKVSRRAFALLPRVQEVPEEDGESEKWNRERCNRWKKMLLRRSWRQRDRQMYGRNSKFGTLTELRNLPMSPKRRADSSERVCSQASTSPPARRKESRRCTSSDHATRTGAHPTECASGAHETKVRRIPAITRQTR